MNQLRCLSIIVIVVDSSLGLLLSPSLLFAMSSSGSVIVTIIILTIQQSALDKGRLIEEEVIFDTVTKGRRASGSRCVCENDSRYVAWASNHNTRTAKASSWAAQTCGSLCKHDCSFHSTLPPACPRHCVVGQ